MRVRALEADPTNHAKPNLIETDHAKPNLIEKKLKKPKNTTKRVITALKQSSANITNTNITTAAEDKAPPPMFINTILTESPQPTPAFPVVNFSKYWSAPTDLNVTSQPIPAIPMMNFSQYSNLPINFNLSGTVQPAPASPVINWSRYLNSPTDVMHHHHNHTAGVGSTGSSLGTFVEVVAVAAAPLLAAFGLYRCIVNKQASMRLKARSRDRDAERGQPNIEIPTLKTNLLRK